MKRQPGTAELASMNLSANMTSGIGQPVRRKEDFRLLTGRGSFADDIHPLSQGTASFSMPRAAAAGGRCLSCAKVADARPR